MAENRCSPPSLRFMRAVQITRFGGPEVLDVVDLPDPVPGEGQQLYEVSTAGVNFADTHHRLSYDPVRPTHADGALTSHPTWRCRDLALPFGSGSSLL